MKRLLSVIAAACLFGFSLLPAQEKINSKNDYIKTLSEKDGEIIYEFNFPRPSLANSAVNGVQSLTVPFFDYTQTAGTPRLPKIDYLLELPEGNPQALIVGDQKENIAVTALPFSVLEDVTTDKNQRADEKKVSVSADRWFPAELLQIRYLGKMRGIPLFRLTLCPYRYNPATKQVEFHKKLTVKISYSTAAKVQIQENNLSDLDAVFEKQTLNHTSAKRSRQLKSLLNSSVVMNKSSENAVTGISAVTTNPFLKIIVDTNGIYKMDYNYLKQKSGYNFANIDPRTFRLFNQGLQVPIYVRGEADGIFSGDDFLEFYGEGYRAKFNRNLRDIPSSKGHYLDPWSDDNVYFLTWDGPLGLRLIEENAGIVFKSKTNPIDTLLQTSYTTTKHFEKDAERLDIKNINLIQPSVVEDIWGFDKGISNITSGETTKEYSFAIEKPAGTFVNLRINFQGISTNAHLVDVFINNTRVTSSTLTWSGATKLQVDIAQPNATLNNGENKLRIVTQTPQNSTLDQLALNWFEVTYKKDYSADKEYIEFLIDGDSHKQIRDFVILNFKDPNISIYKKGVSRLVNWDINPDPGLSNLTYFVKFQDTPPTDDVEYIAVSESAKRLPKDIVPDKPSALRNGYHNARYLIITPKFLHDAVFRLEDYRRSKGWSAETVDLEDIYDEFNFGIKSPYAIRDFLRYTYSSPNWQGAQGSPLYVLLVGDASFNPKTSGFDILPVQEIQTEKFGPAASDFWYSLADDRDILPDFFVGRLPVTTSDQLNAIINKIISYEQSSNPGLWKNKVLFIGGQSEDRGVAQGNPEIPRDVFRYQYTNIINDRMAQRFSPDRIVAYPNHDQFVGGASKVINAFSEGTLITTYIGHGGGGIWGDLDSAGRPLLNNDQVLQANFNPGKFPIVLSMTCFVGSFDNDQSTLGEVLLKTPNKGAVGVLASSGTGWIIGDFELLDQSINSFLQNGMTAGQAVTQGKINYLILKGLSDLEVSGGGNSVSAAIEQSMVFQFNYLGDPATRIQAPVEKTLTLSNYSPQKTSTIIVSGTADFASGSGIAEIYQLKPVTDSVPNGGNKPSFVTLDTVNFTITGGAYSFAVDLASIPQNILNNGASGIRIFGESAGGGTSFNAQNNFTVNGAYLAQIQTVPQFPTSTDSVKFKALTSDPQGINYVIAAYDRTGSVTQSGLDTLFSIGNNFYQSGGVGPFSEGDFIAYRIKVYNNTGDSTVSSQQKIQILAGIDLSLGNIINPGDPVTSISLSGSDSIRIDAVVQNLGFAPVENILIRFYDGDPGSGGILLGQTHFNIGGSIANAGKIAADTVSIASTLTNGTHSLYVWVDPDSSVNDANRANNLGSEIIQVNRFNVTPAFGTTFNGTKNDTVSIDSGFFVNVPPNAIAQNAVISISRTTGILLVNQPDLQFAYPMGFSSPQAYQVDFRAPLLNNKTASVQFAYDTTIYQLNYQDSLAIYRWDSGNRKWNMVTTNIQKQSGKIAVQISDYHDIGLFTLMINRDRSAPIIKPTIEGQFFSQGSIAPKNPKISAIIFDRNGVSLERKNYLVRVNDQPLDVSKIILPDSLANSNTVALTLNLSQNFQDGDNLVTFQVADVNGNVSDADTLRFKVVTNFDIQMMGNFPNPFVNTTTFVFRVDASEQLDDLQISIYTVSGRRIRKMTPANTSDQILNSIGYHEVQWDAKDDDGHNIANGIYFYLLKGKLKGKVVEKKGKIAYFR